MASPSRSRGLGLKSFIFIGMIAFLLLLVGFYFLARGPGAPQANLSATATTQTQITSTAQAKAQATSNALATSTAQANATASAQASATAAASATATAVKAILVPIICKYMYWQTGINTQKTLTNFGVPQGCVLVLDSFGGTLNGVTWSNGGVMALSPVNWNNGGVMAFPSGVYSGVIFNGEYAIVPEKDNPNPEQVFCNRVQQLVTNGYAFSNAQPLPEWGLPPGSQIVAQHHC